MLKNSYAYFHFKYAKNATQWDLLSWNTNNKSQEPGLILVFSSLKPLFWSSTFLWPQKNAEYKQDQTFNFTISVFPTNT